MNVSTYLEAFLSVYGWEMYSVFYLLLGMTGLFLYPFAKIINDAYVAYLSGNEFAGTNYIKQAITQMIYALLIFILALVPMINVSFDETTVKTMCAEKKDVAQINKAGAYFKNADTKVPIMPWLAMSFGQGVNNVIYNTGTCTLDVTDLKRSMMNLDLRNAENPELLSAELNRFVGECHAKAKNITNKILAGQYDTDTEKVSTVLREKINDYEKDTDQTQRVIMGNYDSPLFRDVFYSQGSILSNYDTTSAIVPLLADGPVEGIDGYESVSGQEGKSASVPSCSDWWAVGGSKSSLKKRVVEALETSVIARNAKNLGVKGCRNDIVKWGNNRDHYVHETTMSGSRKEECRQIILAAGFDGNRDKFYSDVLKSVQGKSVTGGTLEKSDNAAIGAAGIAAIAGTVLSAFTGVDVTGGAIGQITGFYIGIYLLKLLLTFLIPMILMAVYMFWGFFMAVGRLSGEVLTKGMVLITSLTVIPGLWAMVDHLDDKLFGSMYADSSGGMFDRMLLDVATGIFQLVIISILFYLIGEAGSSRPSGIVDGSQKGAGSVSSGLSNSVTKGLGGVGNKIKSGLNNHWKKVGK